MDTLITVEDLIVKGKKSVGEAALTTTLIDSVQIAESTNGSLADLLTKHTPVFIKTYGQGSLATVSFRGTAASHTQVEWNGININNPMLGQVDFSLIPVWFVDKTELFHGGSSLSEGSGALGGSISIGSQPRWGEKFYGSVLQGIGSFGTYQTFVSAGGGGKRVHVRARYLYEQAENDFTFLNTAVLPYRKMKQQNADYRKTGGVADLFWNAGKSHYLSLHAWFHHADRNLPTVMSYEGLGREEKQQDDELRLVAQWKKFGKKFISELVSGYTNTGVDYYLRNMTDLGAVLNYDSRSEIHSFYNKYRFEYSFSEKSVLKLLVNGDYHKVDILDHITKEGYSANRTQLGISAGFHHKFSEVWSGYVLLREDFIDNEFTPLMPSVGIEIVPFKKQDFHIIANGTRNYHQPTLNDLYWLPGGNPNLKPEEGYTVDVAANYRYEKKRLRIESSLTGYMSWVDDWIVWRPSEYRYWTAENIRKVFARGVEVSVMAGYNIAGVNMALRGNYGFTRTTNQDTPAEKEGIKGKQLIYIPINKANVMFDADWKGFYLNYLWSFTGERYTTSSNEKNRHLLPAYALHNMTLGKKIHFSQFELDAQFKINNLFDKNYQAILWRAMPRRNYSFLIKFSY